MEASLVLIFAGCFVLVGVGTGLFFVYRIIQGVKSARWPFVLGDLESDALKEVVFRGRSIDGGVDSASARVVNFKYSYSVANRKFHGSRVTWSDGINKTARALRRLRQKYRGKSLVKVYYNPQSPAQSVLVPGLSIFNFTPLITSILFILAGLFVYGHDFTGK